MRSGRRQGRGGAEAERALLGGVAHKHTALPEDGFVCFKHYNIMTMLHSGKENTF